MRKRLRRGLINFIAKHLYKTITSNDLLRRKGERLFVGGRTLTKESTQAFEGESARLLESSLWKYLKLDLEHHAIEKSLHKADTMEDVISGKLLLYLIDVIEDRLKKVAKGK